MKPERLQGRAATLSRRLGGWAVEGFFEGLSGIGRAVPLARPELYGIRVLRDLAYREGGQAAHRLDVHKPRGTAPYPVVFYVHGGGFSILSKETHWLMALAFARRGFLVFNVEYRLAPANPYPAALEDVCAAWGWLARNLESFGGDPERVVLAGESAGANLVTSLALASSCPRPEPFAKAAFDAGLAPAALVAACGLLQVSDIERFVRRRRLPRWLFERMQSVSDGYLRGAHAAGPGGLELADPLLVLERAEPPARRLPPVFAFAGTRDPVLDDTRRLGAALARLGVAHRVRIYPGELHAFHALVWRRQARQSWRETFDFLAESLPSGSDRLATSR